MPRRRFQYARRPSPSQMMRCGDWCFREDFWKEPDKLLPNRHVKLLFSTEEEWRWASSSIRDQALAGQRHANRPRQFTFFQRPERLH
jgi:hypothetical protein